MLVKTTSSLTKTSRRSITSMGRAIVRFRLVRQSVLLAIASLLTVQACANSKPVTAAEIPGRYGMRSGDSTDSLELKDNGEYYHRFWNGSNLKYAGSGKWTFTTKEGDRAVEFSKFLPSELFLPRTPLEPEGPPGWWIAPISRDRAGKLRILVTSDIGLYYTHL